MCGRGRWEGAKVRERQQQRECDRVGGKAGAREIVYVCVNLFMNTINTARHPQITEFVRKATSMSAGRREWESGSWVLGA